jgi:hypothetical protein
MILLRLFTTLATIQTHSFTPYSSRKRGETEIYQTYRFLLIPLNDSKRPLITRILHDEPTQRFLVFGVDLARFDEFGFEFGNGFGIGFRVEVHDDCVDHYGGFGAGLLGCKDFF